MTSKCCIKSSSLACDIDNDTTDCLLTVYMITSYTLLIISSLFWIIIITASYGTDTGFGSAISILYLISSLVAFAILQLTFNVINNVMSRLNDCEDELFHIDEPQDLQ